AIAESAIGTVAIAARTVVAVALLHHRRRAFLVGFDRNGHVAKNVFVDAHLALHLVDGGGRSVDVHQRVMGLAVLLDAAGGGLEAPVLDPAGRAAVRFDHALVLFDESVDLLGGHVLAGQEYMFVKSHVALPFLRLLSTRSQRQASTTVLKGGCPGKKSVSSRRSRAETREAGALGPERRSAKIGSPPFSHQPADRVF